MRLYHDQPIQRQRGLLQGSPLSALLSNVYLDAFDEEMERRGHRLVRYGDDVLLLLRPETDAVAALAFMRDHLHTHFGLTLKEEKTRLTPLDGGLQYLGLEIPGRLDAEWIGKEAFKKPLFVRQLYGMVGIDGGAVEVRTKGKLLARYPLERVSEIVIFGNNVVSTRLLQRCVRRRIPVSLCSPAGAYINTLAADPHSHFERRARHRARHAAHEPDGGLTVARRLVQAKLMNYHHWFLESGMPHFRKVVGELEIAASQASKATHIDVLRGIEGQAAKRCFRAINRRVADAGFHSRARLPREKPDPWNVLLDFAYHLLFTRLNVLLRSQGLDPFLGWLHSPANRYESLVCDLQEPFRCRIDRFLVRLVNRRQFQPTDFEDTDGRWTLRNDAVGRFLEAFEEEQYRQFRFDPGTFKDLLHAQVLCVKRWVEHDHQPIILYHAKASDWRT